MNINGGFSSLDMSTFSSVIVRVIGIVLVVELSVDATKKFRLFEALKTGLEAKDVT